MAVVGPGGTQLTVVAFPSGRHLSHRGLRFSSLGHVVPSSSPDTLTPLAPLSIPGWERDAGFRKRLTGQNRCILCTSLKVHGHREDASLPMSSPLLSPEWSGAGGPEAAQTPYTALQHQPTEGPSPTPAAFHLPNYQAEVAVQFALFL